MQRGYHQTISILLLFFTQIIGAQQSNDRLIEEQNIREKVEFALSELNLTQNQYEFEISNYHYNIHTGVTFVYLQQYYSGVEVYKSMFTLAFNDSKQIVTANRIQYDLQAFIQEKTVGDIDKCLVKAAQHLKLPLHKSKGNISQTRGQEFEISNIPYASELIKGRLVWAKNDEGIFELAYAFIIPSAISSDHWEIVIGQKDGDVLHEINHTLYCSMAGEHDFHHADEYRLESSVSKKLMGQNRDVNDGSAYNVFPPPLESPDFGERQLIENPALESASPFGWHDTDGLVGPEFQTLRGNNTHAYEDTESENEPPQSEPSSIVGLVFDFPYQEDTTVDFNLNADLTNLFFWNNYMHDWSFELGFDEAAGNFQQINYSNVGQEGDHVLAEALDGSDTNNATFSAPRDGSNGRMQMHRWIITRGFEIEAPSSVSGTYQTGVALFGPSQLNNDIEAEIILVDDGVGVTTDACDPILNGDEFAGKIAMVDRGDCQFSEKVFAVQKEGAAACIICNNNPGEGIINMSGGINADSVTIPSTFLSREDCEILKRALDEGLIGRFNSIQERSSGFDNGIIVHEFGHGITLRLAGGSQTSGCLNNDEEMGEGWSDFFALVLTQLPDDNKNTARPIGTYVIGQNREGRGIRRYPYSFDMNVNPQVQSHIRSTVRPHDVGEIWASALWDMYWLYIEEYGYDPTWNDRLSGNFMALQDIIDGVKLQACDPSLTEARDAILDADRLNNNGDNACIIWEAFARRGLGTDAFGGSPNSRRDNINGFAMPPSCSGEILLDKSMTKLIDVGDTIEVTLTVQNYKEDAVDLILNDEIPSGTSVLLPQGSNAEINENTISFEIENLPLGSIQNFSYSLLTSSLTKAEFSTYVDFESSHQFEGTTTSSGVNSWRLTTSQSSSGIFSFRVIPDTIGGESIATFSEGIMINATNSLLKFDHFFNTDVGIDGGVIDISTDGGNSWNPIEPELFMVNGYSDEISDCLFNCPFPDFFYRRTLPSYTGDRDWSSTVVDLSSFVGQEVMLRFRYISLLFMDNPTRSGWFFDDFEIYEHKELAGESCLLSSAETIACVSDFTLINSDARRTPVTEIVNEGFEFRVTPNPADDEIRIQLNVEEKLDGTLRIISIDGRVLQQDVVEAIAGNNELEFDVHSYTPGMYFIELSDQHSRYALAFIKQ